MRFRLTGSVSPSLVISKKEFAAAFPKLFYADVKDETLPLWDSGYLKNDMTVRGEFYRMIEPQLGSADRARTPRGDPRPEIRYGGDERRKHIRYISALSNSGADTRHVAEASRTAAKRFQSAVDRTGGKRRSI